MGSGTEAISITRLDLNLVNIFVLNAGRCGSTTFIQACQHISNYTAQHESLSYHLGEQRLSYPSYHIEADNRLSWFLGRLDREYGNNALYVHLSRGKVEAAQSFSRREQFGIMKAYREGILMGGLQEQSAYDLAMDYLHTVESNIELFLKDKDRVMNFSLESAKDDFRVFWGKAGAEGDLDKALLEWDKSYNASG